MKKITARMASAIMILLIISTIAVSAFAEKKTYSDSLNSGIRDEICLSLDGTGAESYYSGNEYEKLSAMSDAELLAALRSLMTVTHTYKSTYAESRDLATKTDCEGENGKIVLL